MAELTELRCPNCGAKLEGVGHAARAECPHCGTELLIERKATAVAKQAEPLACPKCGKNDRVQKVSSVHSSGLSRSSFRGDVWTKNGFDPVSMSGHSQTELSRLFNPPKKPGSRTWAGIALVAFGSCCLVYVSMWLCGGLYLLFFDFDLGRLAFLAFAVLTGLLCVFLPLRFGLRKLTSKRQQFPVDKARWERAMDRWERLYYCARDHGVFIPSETSLMPIDEIQKFLYTSTYRRGLVRYKT